MTMSDTANGTTTHTVPKMRGPHPLDQLSTAEIEVARTAVLQARRAPVMFRNIYNYEPPKAELVGYLAAEHAGTLTTKRPARRARAQYDVIESAKSRRYMESTVDLASGAEVETKELGAGQQQSITIDEFLTFQAACAQSDLFRDAVKAIHLPEGFEVVIDPWPYGGPDPDEAGLPRILQGLCFAKDVAGGNPDSNHYGYPLPIIPVMDWNRKEIIRIDKLATGGHDDGLAYSTGDSSHPVQHCKPAEYVPELLETPLRADLKPLDVVQPDGASFTVTDDSLIEWQKWRLRVSFTPRECAVLHDVHYDGRSVLHRLSLSEMTVPYGDPRPPYHRKQAFDFGDTGAGRAANNLALGCDCLGAIKYIDAMLVDGEGKPSVSKNVVCIHEQDDGILWKHTNFRTDRAVVVRNRVLVIQFIITLANYEYLFAYRLDLAGGITVEIRATGIVSVVNIDPGKTPPYGNVVAPGAMAQNHQHIFAVRIDPAVDGHNNTVSTEDSLAMPMNPDTNPHGNGYEVRSTPIKTSTHIDASPFTNRIVKIANPHKHNAISGKPVAYKFTPAATQKILADPKSIVAQRARFAQHHVWVTAHRDHEFWAGGEFTNQSQVEQGGCHDAAARGDAVEDADVVVWNVFSLTHNPRVEDWPVMPMEKFELHLRPADFFDANPALDVPGNRNLASVEIMKGPGQCCATNGDAKNGNVQGSSVSHMQGSGTIDVNGH